MTWEPPSLFSLLFSLSPYIVSVILPATEEAVFTAPEAGDLLAAPLDPAVAFPEGAVVSPAEAVVSPEEAEAAAEAALEGLSNYAGINSLLFYCG